MVLSQDFEPLSESELEILIAQAEDGDEEAAALLADLDEALEDRIDVETPPEWFHEGQLRAWGITERIALLLWGHQSGKTVYGPHWLLREIVRTATEGEANDYLLAGPTIELLKKKALPTLIRVMGAYGEYNSSDRAFRFSAEGVKKLTGFTSASVTVFVGYATKHESLVSATYKAAWLDEAGQDDFKLESWEEVVRRLAIHRGRVLITTTPYAWNWLKTVIADKAGDHIKVIPFESIQNPAYPRDEWERALVELPEWKFDLFYRGVFTRPLGQIYDCFEQEFNTCKRFKIPEDWPLLVGVDFGPDNTACVLCARELDDFGEKTGRVYAIATYHGGSGESENEQDTAAGHIRKLREMAMKAIDGVPQLPLGYAGAGRNEMGWRGFWTLAGQPLNKPSDGSVEFQIQCIWTAMKRRIDKGRFPGKAQLVVFDDLQSLIGDINSYSRVLDPSGNRTEDIADKSKWHRLDALRYLGPDVFAFPISKGTGVTVHKRNHVGKQIDEELAAIEAAMFRRSK